MLRTNYIDTNGPASGVGAPLPPLTWGAWLKSGVRLLIREVRRGAEIVYLWHQRGCSRRHLMTLDDRLLKDIGLSRTDAETEYRKRFWQN